ncbi:MAG: cyclic nucleotide-binding domain-containing protein [Myxococcales bacterium]|nr:cyclic nucleotide-binding domain-containing protein [Myxococcales bacterium]MCB9705374.1 cyclic nucleotide-binding domain-containing protein [Myxococcales bacterium]
MSLLSRTSLLITRRRRPALATHPLFEGIDRADVIELIDHLDLRSYAAGEHVVRQGERADALFVIAEGAVMVVRADDQGEEHTLKRLGPGELFGEAGLFLDEVRSASVKAAGPAKILRLPYDALRSADADASGSESSLGASGSMVGASGSTLSPGGSMLGPVAARIVRNLGGVVARRMTSLNDAAVQHLRERLQMGHFFVGLTCLLAFYTFGLSLDRTFAAELRGYGPLVSIGMLATIALGCVLMIRKLGWRLDRFGVHLHRLGPVLGESLAVSAVILALLTAGKWLLIQLHPGFAGAPLIGFGARLEMYGASKLIVLALSYAVFAPIQEFIARGVLQTALEEFVSFERKTLAAILISNLLFAALHLHVSYTLAGLAFVSGLLWGWMYARQRSLVGVAVSHVVIGLYAIYFLASTPI